MGYRDQFYPQTVALMIQRYGEAAPDASGNRLPVTTPVQTLGVLGTLSPNIIRILDNFQTRVGTIIGDTAHGAMQERYVDGDGIMNTTAAENAMALATLLPWKDYVAGIPKPGSPAARTTLARTGSYYVPWVGEELLNKWAETGLLATIRQMMIDWQAAVDASAEGIRYQVDINKPMVPVNNATFWAAIRRLTTTMDVIDENPPQELFARIKDALGYSLDKSSEFAGEAAAKIAERVGETAGLIGKGFFAEAGILSIVVAGIAVYLFVS